MTILDYVKSKNAMGINDWIKEIEKDGYSKYERQIIRCADDLNKITVKHDADFINAINI